MEDDSNQHAIEDIGSEYHVCKTHCLKPLIYAELVTHETAGNVPENGRAPHAESQTCCHSMTGRNLVMCIDGTANQFGDKNTNVIELYNPILKEVEDRQRTWYNSGIGTYARPSWKSLKFHLQVLHHKVDLAIAWEFEKTVLAAYRWLSDNYEPGDCIFLFGFSRGAFQVRVLSAMIDKVGLIYKGNEITLYSAYELYADPKSDSQPATRVGSQTPEKMSSASERFKQAFSYKNVKVHFVGAWDTVSSIGIARGTHMLPRTVDGMQHVCYFRHALALDERRVKFLPEYAYGGSSIAPSDKATNLAIKHSFRWNSLAGQNSATSANLTIAPQHTTTNETGASSPQTLEVWFAGTHSDIGGGNVKNAGMDRSQPPLRWMVFEAAAHGLRTSEFARKRLKNERIEIKESLTGIWWLLEILPFKHLTYTREEHGATVTRKPHLGSPRKIHVGQKIHSSFFLTSNVCNGEPYTPKACPLHDDTSFWQPARWEKELCSWLVPDTYEHLDSLVDRFIDEPDIDLLVSLHQIASWSKQASIFTRYLHSSLALKILSKKCWLLQSSMEILAKSPDNLKHHHSTEIRRLIHTLSTSPDHHHVLDQFMAKCTTSCIYVLHEHTDTVCSIACSPDGKCIVSGSVDATIQLWDVETGKQFKQPLRGHTNLVFSVTFSHNSKHIVSGSGDQTVRIWDVEAGTQVGTPFQGHRNSVRCVAFSPDHKHFVSGSDDKTVRLWDLETEQEVRVFQCTNLVLSVAFSLDGKQIASGLNDWTILIWNSETGTPIGEPIRGHTSFIWSVAFSPNRKHTVSGSKDKTVRIWNLETGRQVGEPLKGHTDSVLSVAFSPDGKRIVSGSFDGTVRMWNSETRQQIGEPYTGHTDWVWSVAFSPDGKYVVSGSEDKTVRIWDAETYETAV
ncbi:hypothetical protein HYPSUDRAFT_137751 [Hypholoma sublateritium FD-334 SS-4]|uniref:Uncharacterized protein n=1 Tax=Hypholoma sublateritium (strain FD-334 SS-4) TaxID=945553 RepID=A0A0D2P418_HYPSF|nr:hypothetical protein HYPSUDRAFT_137751 [Hypholoma sublateritium FD-334 SS-4]